MKFALGFFVILLLIFTLAPLAPGSDRASAQTSGQYHETLFIPGPSFNVGEIVYPSGHDFDTSSGIDTCLSLNVPAGDTFTLSLEWEALFGDQTNAGDLDLYIYLDSACTESALLTSSFNSNAYTGELAELTPQVRNIGSSPAVAGIRIGKRSGRGNPGQLRLQVQTGTSTFLEHGTDGPPLGGQEGAPVFEVTGPFSIPENSPIGSIVGQVTATDAQSDPLTFFELEPAAGQTSFLVDPQTGVVTVEDPTLLDRELTATLLYWVGVTDGVSASLASIGINLSGVNDNPPIALPTSVITAPDTSIVISLSGTDADIDPAQTLTVSIVTQPTNGSVGTPVSLTEDSSSVVYTSTPGFIGNDSFTFAVSDGFTTSAPVTVDVTVTDDPTAIPTPTPDPQPGATTTVPPTATPTGGGATPVLPPVFVPPPGGAPPAPVFGAPVDTVSPPSAPRFLRSEARDGSVVITWQRPLSDGGAPIDGYRIFNINAASSTFVPGDAVEGQVRGLENGTSYLFQVRAFNSAGFGEGALVGPVTPVSADLIPLDVRATVHPDDTVTVWWSGPEGDHLEPIALYRLWIDGGDLVETVAPDEPLIVTVSELAGDAFYSFRVTAADADDELTATGITDPVYLPPTLASAYDPLPADAILIPLTEQAHTELQLALQDAAGGEGVVADAPAILTVREGEAVVFVHVEGLHRAVVLPGDFTVATDQLSISNPTGDSLEFDLEIEDGVRVSGVIDTLVDPTGILFRLAAPEIELAHVLTNENETINSFEIAYSATSLTPGFTIQAETQSTPPLAVNEVLADPEIREVAGVILVTRSGLILHDPGIERVRLSLDTTWHEAQVDAGNDIRLIRITGAGEITSVPITCEPGMDAVSCTAELEGEGDESSFYAVAAVSDGTQPDPDGPTPEPTVLSAPTEPTATVGPSLVVVQEPTPVPAPLPTVPAAEPQATPTPSVPELPESGGGTSPVTWLMSGILGLVVIRGAFYAVGRFRA